MILPPFNQTRLLLFSPILSDSFLLLLWFLFKDSGSHLISMRLRTRLLCQPILLTFRIVLLVLVVLLLLFGTVKDNTIVFSSFYLDR